MADNASNNDKMIDHLAILVDTFPGAANQMRCFAHILNLVAKRVLCQFKAPKKGKSVDDAAKELAAVIDESSLDKDKEASDDGSDDNGNECDDVDDDVVDDDEDGVQDDELSEDELMSVKENVKPIRLVLTKVSQFNIHKHHSTNQQ